jgi:phosphotransferase system  glucose/maltose/N-acetylglucosamine-specific IIC component
MNHNTSCKVAINAIQDLTSGLHHIFYISVLYKNPKSWSYKLGIALTRDGDVFAWWSVKQKKSWKVAIKSKTRTWQDVGLHHIFYKSVLYKTLNLEARNLTLHWRQEMADLFTCEIGSNVCKTNPRLQWKKKIGDLRSIEKTTAIRWELYCWLGQKLETKLHTYELELRHRDPTA